MADQVALSNRDKNWAAVVSYLPLAEAKLNESKS